jgi:flagellar biosynthesis/type III secretory pathway protein FliH
VDAEEKKLLRDADCGSYLNRETNFRSHCFPDIQFEGPDSDRVCAPQVDKFHRVKYDNKTKRADRSSDFDNPETRSGRIPSKVDQFDMQAYQKGFNDGLEKGTKEGEVAGFEHATKKLEPLLQGLQEILMQVGNLRQNTYRIIEQEVVELALAIARKVICREIEVDKEVVVCVAREALSKVEDPGSVKIKMNPSDYQFINSTKYQISELVGNIDNVTIEPRKNIRSGGCVIETNLGEIDARIEQQLQAIEDSFRNALENTSAKAQDGQLRRFN